MNWTEGVGEKPIGGTTDAPVVKANIFTSLDGPSVKRKILSVVVGPINVYVNHL